MSKESVEGTVSNGSSGPQLAIYSPLEKAGFDPGDTVTIEAGNGYVVITPASADVPISEVNVEDRPNVKDQPIESDFEARVVGNRLWEIGEKYEQIGKTHVAEETKELARRFHKFSNGEIHESL